MLEQIEKLSIFIQKINDDTLSHLSDYQFTPIQLAMVPKRSGDGEVLRIYFTSEDMADNFCSRIFKMPYNIPGRGQQKNARQNDNGLWQIHFHPETVEQYQKEIRQDLLKDNKKFTFDTLLECQDDLFELSKIASIYTQAKEKKSPYLLVLKEIINSEHTLSDKILLCENANNPRKIARARQVGTLLLLTEEIDCEDILLPSWKQVLNDVIKMKSINDINDYHSAFEVLTEIALNAPCEIDDRFSPHAMITLTTIDWFILDELMLYQPTLEKDTEVLYQIFYDHNAITRTVSESYQEFFIAQLCDTEHARPVRDKHKATITINNGKEYYTKQTVPGNPNDTYLSQKKPASRVPFQVDFNPYEEESGYPCNRKYNAQHTIKYPCSLPPIDGVMGWLFSDSGFVWNIKDCSIKPKMIWKYNASTHRRYWFAGNYSESCNYGTTVTIDDLRKNNTKLRNQNKVGGNNELLVGLPKKQISGVFSPRDNRETRLKTLHSMYVANKAIGKLFATPILILPADRDRKKIEGTAYSLIQQIKDLNKACEKAELTDEKLNYLLECSATQLIREQNDNTLDPEDHKKLMSHCLENGLFDYAELMEKHFHNKLLSKGPKNTKPKYDGQMFTHGPLSFADFLYQFCHRQYMPEYFVSRKIALEHFTEAIECNDPSVQSLITQMHKHLDGERYLRTMIIDELKKLAFGNKSDELIKLLDDFQFQLSDTLWWAVDQNHHDIFNTVLKRLKSPDQEYIKLLLTKCLENDLLNHAERMYEQFHNVIPEYDSQAFIRGPIGFAEFLYETNHSQDVLRYFQIKKISFDDFNKAIEDNNPSVESLSYTCVCSTGTLLCHLSTTSLEILFCAGLSLLSSTKVLINLFAIVLMPN